MDKRSSKETMLNRISYLEERLTRVYRVGMEGIEQLGIANYQSRLADAEHNLNAAYFDEIYEDSQTDI